MGGGSRKRAAKIAGFVALLTLGLASAALASSGDGSQAPNVAAHRLDTQVHEATLQLYALDTQLGAAQGRLAALENDAARLRAQRAALRQELVAVRGTLRVSRRELALRLRELYEQGNVDPVAVLLGASSLGTGLRRLDDLQRMTDQDRRVVALTTKAQRRLVHARRSLALDAQRLTRSLASARAAERTLAGAAASRSTYLSSLRARLRQTQVQAVSATAGAAAQKSAQIQAPTPTTRPTPPTPPAAGGRTLTVSATCYDLSGTTATGMPVGWGIVAVDPGLIPLGTKLYIPGYGKGVAADVGGGIKGAIIDLWMPPAQCGAWGRRTVTITVY